MRREFFSFVFHFNPLKSLFPEIIKRSRRLCDNLLSSFISAIDKFGFLANWHWSFCLLFQVPNRNILLLINEFLALILLAGTSIRAVLFVGTYFSSKRSSQLKTDHLATGKHCIRLCFQNQRRRAKMAAESCIFDLVLCCYSSHSNDKNREPWHRNFSFYIF